jgi:23S rRNA (uracil1939-C5)-methyltransferase
VDRVVSVDSVESASVDGVFNSETNNVDNVVFLTQTVENYLRDELNQHGHLQPNSVVMVDPPRAGLHPKALKRLMLLKPREIIYVSCKPEVFTAELATFQTLYDLRDVSAFDLFPHTGHVELLARLHLK